MAPDDLCALFFTSGSTGRPKGTPRTARQLDEQHENYTMLFAETAPEAVFLPLHFVGGFYGAIHAAAVGRRVMLIDPRATGPREIADMIDDARIERLTITPSLTRALVDVLGGRRLQALVELRLVAEPVEWGHVADARRLGSESVTVQVLYGASEIIGLLNHGFRIGPDVALGTGRVPLGAMPGAERARIEPVEGTDRSGQLLVREPIIDGYWNDPELTAERFGTDPDGVRFWRSGDAVSVDGDGLLHVHGRLDDMVKVNGRLVEPAAAEAVLNDLPDVRAAVVLPRTLPTGRRQLVGHVEADPSVRVGEVRSAMAERLPAYAIPNPLVRHDSIPIGDRGKTDLALLRSTPIDPWRTGSTDRPPTTTERAVLDVLGSILDLASVDLDDDIWDIGCDSLGALELVEALADRFSVRVEPNALMDHSTASAIAGLVDDHRRPTRDWVAVHRPDGASPMIHFVCGAGAAAVGYRALLSGLAPDQPVVFYEQRGLQRRGRPDRSIDAVVAANLDRLRVIDPSAPIVIAGHSFGAVVANDMANRLVADGRSVHLVLIDPVSLSGGTATSVTTGVRRAAPFVRRPRRIVDGILIRARRFARPGSITRYRAWGAMASKMALRHEVVPFAGSTTHVRAADEGVAPTWTLGPEVPVIDVVGDHTTVALARGTAEVLTRAVAELRAGI